MVTFPSLKTVIPACFPPQAPRRILEEEVTVRLSSSSDTIILQTPPVPPRVSQMDHPYERIFLLDPQYQDPAGLRNKLPELSRSAETSGEHLSLFSLPLLSPPTFIFLSIKGIMLLLSPYSSHVAVTVTRLLQINLLIMPPASLTLNILWNVVCYAC